MCPMEEKIVSCELSFYPLGLKDYNEPIDRVLKIIEASNLDCNIGSMSTIIRGPIKDILLVIEQIDTSMEGKFQYVMNMKISNTCGC